MIYVGVAIFLLHAAVSVVYVVWVVSMARRPGTDDRNVGKLLAMGMQSGRLGSSENSVSLDGDDKSSKKMWRTRYGLRSIGSEEDARSGGRGETKKTETIILERI